MKKLLASIVTGFLLFITFPADANVNYRLKIVYQDSPEAKAVTWQLTCNPAGGNHPHPNLACREIRRAVNPFKKPASDEICTKIYGGPQQAVVTGVWAGKKVNRKFTRTDGCEINRWQQLQVTLSGKSK
ncbi:MAG: hypothetical protein FJW76_04710 [Actinobacteria bacterium]|nr:hypothetical protein [Actinomycetota bacterium]